MAVLSSDRLMTVGVIVPTRNEGRNIGWVLTRLPELVDEVVVVDGSSTDDTVAQALAARPDAKIVHQTRRGKGNALACGFEAVGTDLIVMIDADGSMDPGEIAAYVDPLTNGADYAKGSRFTRTGGSDDITTIRRWGNFGLNLATNVLFRSRYTDLCYGYNAFARTCLEAFNLPSTDTRLPPQWGDGFEIETMINVRIFRSGAAIVEVPSYEHLRRHGESNLNTFRDGFRVLRTIVSERFRGRVVRVDRRTALGTVQDSSVGTADRAAQ